MDKIVYSIADVSFAVVMEENIKIIVSDKKLDIEQAFLFSNSPEHGACNSFIGRIRNENLGRDVLGVSYDVCEPLAQNILEKLCGEVLQKWGKNLKIYIAHFKGRLNIGEVSIIISVSSPHRDESFKACRFIIEEIKHRAPIWKQEHYVDGDSEWVQGHALCAH